MDDLSKRLANLTRIDAFLRKLRLVLAGGRVSGEPFTGGLTGDYVMSQSTRKEFPVSNATFCPHCYPCRHAGASNDAERYLRALRLIEHATAPGSDGGGHENAYSIALLAIGDKAARAGGSSQEPSRGRCSYCGGEPCCYPSEGKPECLRDARLRSERAERRDAGAGR